MARCKQSSQCKCRLSFVLTLVLLCISGASALDRAASGESLNLEHYARGDSWDLAREPPTIRESKSQEVHPPISGGFLAVMCMWYLTASMRWRSLVNLFCQSEQCVRIAKPARRAGKRRLTGSRRRQRHRKGVRWKTLVAFHVWWVLSVHMMELCNLQHWMALIMIFAQRFGEAANPGPHDQGDALQIGVVNPTSLAGKLDLIDSLGDGIWALCETSATRVVQASTKRFFRPRNKCVLFSEPVRAHRRGLSEIRGVAQGVGVLSSFRSWNSLQAPPIELKNSSRFIATIVQISCNCCIQVISIYGPHHTSMVHPHAFTDKMLRFALDFAANFKGPTLICGDLNKDLEDLPTWNLLKQCGFCDLAAFHAQRIGVSPSPTCRNSTRYMYMIGTACLRHSLIECDTRQDYMFDSHPVLAATFRRPSLLAPRTRIWFPNPLMTMSLMQNLRNFMPRNNCHILALSWINH